MSTLRREEESGSAKALIIPGMKYFARGVDGFLFTNLTPAPLAPQKLDLELPEDEIEEAIGP